MIKLWCDFSLSDQNTLLQALYSLKNSKIPNLIGLAGLYARMSSADQKILFEAVKNITANFQGKSYGGISQASSNEPLKFL
jgi:hypothetical protein